MSYVITEDPMDLQKMDLAQLRRTLEAPSTTNTKKRMAAVALLMVTNFSRVGEIANMTIEELYAAKEVDPGLLFFCIEVIQKLFSVSLVFSSKAAVTPEIGYLNCIKCYPKC